MLNQLSNSTRTKFVAALDPLNGLFSTETTNNLYRIVQEAVNNIVKHAAATQALVVIACEEQSEGAVQLTIRIMA